MTPADLGFVMDARIGGMDHQAFERQRLQRRAEGRTHARRCAGDQARGKTRAHLLRQHIPASPQAQHMQGILMAAPKSQDVGFL